PNRYLFAGEQLDANVGFYYLRARYYMQALGRFLTTDPEEGNVYDPPSLHRYLYAKSNPVNDRDPSGRESLLEVAVSNFIVKVVSETLLTIKKLGRFPRPAEILKAASQGAISGAISALTSTLGEGLLAFGIGIILNALVSIYLAHLSKDLYSQDVLNALFL